MLECLEQHVQQSLCESREPARLVSPGPALPQCAPGCSGSRPGTPNPNSRHARSASRGRAALPSGCGTTGGIATPSGCCVRPEPKWRSSSTGVPGTGVPATARDRPMRIRVTGWTRARRNRANATVAQMNCSKKLAGCQLRVWQHEDPSEVAERVILEVRSRRASPPPQHKSTGA